MVLTFLLITYLTIVALLKKKYDILFWALLSMSVVVLSLIRNWYDFVEISYIVGAAYNIGLVAFILFTIFVFLKKG